MSVVGDRLKMAGWADSADSVARTPACFGATDGFSGPPKELLLLDGSMREKPNL